MKSRWEMVWNNRDRAWFIFSAASLSVTSCASGCSRRACGSPVRPCLPPGRCRCPGGDGTWRTRCRASPAAGHPLVDVFRAVAGTVRGLGLAPLAHDRQQPEVRSSVAPGELPPPAPGPKVQPSRLPVLPDQPKHLLPEIPRIPGVPKRLHPCSRNGSPPPSSVVPHWNHVPPSVPSCIGQFFELTGVGPDPIMVRRGAVRPADRGRGSNAPRSS